MMSERRRTKLDIQGALQIFPTLRSKVRQRAGLLSGGEKQVLALASALILKPRLLLLDEPSLGLAPHMAGVVFEHLRCVSRDLGLSILVAEQRIRDVLHLSQRVYVMRRGVIAFAGPAAVLGNERRLIEAYFK